MLHITKKYYRGVLLLSCCILRKQNYILQSFSTFSKAELLQEGIFFLIHLFDRDILVMKKLEIEKNKPTFIISLLKVEY